MGRKSKKVLEHKSKKGLPLNEENTYYALRRAEDVLWHIHRGHKSWGSEWYDIVQCHFYSSAIKLVEAYIKDKGNIDDPALEAIRTINEIEDLSNRLKSFDR